MSFQAMTWAIEQKAGSPSAKAVLMSIANYAGQQWTCWPTQQLLADESEQSVDAVQKREKELITRGLLRKVRLRRHGRRTTDFLILAPSALFGAPVDDLWPHLPAGCEPMNDAAADRGSAEEGPENETSTAPEPPVSEASPDATADRGSAETPDSASTLPHQRPHAAATERQQEPAKNQESLPQKGVSRSEPARGLQGEDLAKAQESFERLRSEILGAIEDEPRAFEHWCTLTPSDRETIILAAREWTLQVRASRKPRTLQVHRWMITGKWQGYAKTTSAASRFVLASSPEGAMHRVLWGLAGSMSPPDARDQFGNRGYWVRYAITPQLLALAGAPPQRTWQAFPAGSEHHGAWRSIVRETIGRGIQVRDEKIFAPWPFPPRVDGSLAPVGSTGPPPEISEEEEAEFAGSLAGR